MELFTEITFPDLEDSTVEEHKKLLKSDVSSILDKLVQAVDEDRIIQGIYECVSVLENEPACVKMCIMPLIGLSDISLNIQYKLIGAYCWENEIPVIKAANADKLARYLQYKGRLNKNDTLTYMLITDHSHDNEQRDSLTSTKSHFPV